MQGQINPGTALGIAAAQLAQQGQYKPFTSDGKPTVVNNLITQESQKEAAKQAQIASGIEAMKQQQMQQALQQMLAQKAAPPTPLTSGLGALGADVRMAEGGVVGYSGEEGSEVDLPVNERFKRALRGLYERIETDYMRRAGATPEMIAKKLGQEPPVSPTPRPMSEAETARFQEANVAPSGMPVGAPPPRPPAPERTAQRRPAAEVAKPADAGITSLMGPAVPSGSERQFGEAMAAQARMQLPPERTAQQVRTEREDYYRSLGIDPDFARSRFSRIEAQEARDRAEAEERAKLVEGRKMENLISRLTRAGGARSGLAGLAQAQLGMEPIIAAQRASDERFTAVMRERQIAADKERTATEDMQRALADGDIARAEKSRNDALAARNAKNEMEAKIRAQYAPQLLQAETAAQDRAAKAFEGAEGRKTQLEVARIGQEGRAGGSDAREQRLALSQMKADPDYKRIQEELVAAGKLAMALPNNPRYKARLENAQKEYARLARTYGVDLKTPAPEAAAPAASNDPLGIRK